MTWPPQRRDRDMAILGAAVAAGIFGFVIGWLVRRGLTLSLSGGGNGGGSGGNVTNIWNLPAGAGSMPAGAGSMPTATLAAALAPPNPAWTPPAGLPLATGGVPQALPRNDLGSSVNHDTQLMSLTVGTTPAQIFNTPDDRYYKVQVRAVAPPGSFVLIATDQSSLRSASAAAPAPNTLVIPVGQWNEIRLKPRQPLYAVANVAGAVLSIAAFPEAL